MREVITSWYSDVRLTRSSYFFSHLGQGFAFLVAIFIAAFWGGVFNSEGLTGFLAILFAIPFMFFQVKIVINRLHDIGQTGWLCLFFIIPVVNFIFGLYVLFTPGDDCENQYGTKRV